MAVLIDSGSRVLIQGITGREGQFHTQQMIAYAPRVVGGVTPGKGGTEIEGVPVFDSVAEAAEAVQPTVSAIFVPPPFGADAILEALDAGIRGIVCITEGIPTQDMIRVFEQIQRSGSWLVGPNCPGVISPGKCKIGIMPGHIHLEGSVGLVSRSGTLAYEVVGALTSAGIGQSTCVGIGGDPIPGSSFVDVLKLFEADDETKVVVLMGEIGGSDEEDAAEFIKTMAKPVAAFIAGKTAPPGKRMGHAGAIVSGSSGTADAKIAALTAAGATVVEITAEIPDAVRALLSA